jgi:hypothetical protein
MWKAGSQQKQRISFAKTAFDAGVDNISMQLNAPAGPM